jgi:transketolase
MVIGMHSFGMSAPMAAAAEKFGFTVDKVVAAAEKVMA